VKKYVSGCATHIFFCAREVDFDFRLSALSAAMSVNKVARAMDLHEALNFFTLRRLSVIP
jgi:hypothetical protein